jgi:hypothetical protein
MDADCAVGRNAEGLLTHPSGVLLAQAARGQLMEKRVFGRTGMELSVLGFGCGAVGGLMVRGDARDQERTIARAITTGVNYFDTAVQYGNGESEKNLGRILQKLRPTRRCARGGPKEIFRRPCARWRGARHATRGRSRSAAATAGRPVCRRWRKCSMHSAGVSLDVLADDALLGKRCTLLSFLRAFHPRSAPAPLQRRGFSFHVVIT